MHRVEGEDYGLDGTKKIYKEANPPLVKATRVPAAHLNAIQEEICKIIETAGLTLKTSATETSDQLYTALRTGRLLLNTSLSATAGINGSQVNNEPSASLVEDVLETPAQQLPRIGAIIITGDGATYVDAPTENGLFAVIPNGSTGLPSPSIMEQSLTTEIYTSGLAIHMSVPVWSDPGGTNDFALVGQSSLIFIGLSYGDGPSPVAGDTECFHVYVTHGDTGAPTQYPLFEPVYGKNTFVYSRSSTTPSAPYIVTLDVEDYARSAYINSVGYLEIAQFNLGEMQIGVPLIVTASGKKNVSYAQPYIKFNAGTSVTYYNPYTSDGNDVVSNQYTTVPVLVNVADDARARICCTITKVSSTAYLIN